MISAVSIWAKIPTYSYCFLVLPISLWLIHRRRASLLALEPRPSAWGVAAVAAATLAWFIGEVAAVAELRQLAVVALLDATVLAFLGPRLCRRILLPLLYLFLLVPTGTVLLPSLQAITTALAVSLLRASGFLLFADGTTLEMPHGTYVVAAGCAGLNFLLASLALSLVYADLLYGRALKRVACVAAALGLSVLSNGVRVYGIIAVAEWSHRRIDIVSDHLLYGWGFFSLVLLAAMALGHRFADPPPVRAEPAPIMPATPRRLRTGLLAAGAAVVGLVSVGHAAARPFLATLPEPLRIGLSLPPTVGGWRQVPAGDGWQPSAAQADARQRWSYAKGNRRVDLVAAYVWRQRDGHKLPPLEDWVVADGAWAAAPPHIRRAGRPVAVQRLAAGDRQRLVYAWYWVAGRDEADPLAARLREMLARLHGDGRLALLALSTAAVGDGEAEAALDDFMAGAAAIDDALARALPDNPG